MTAPLPEAERQRWPFKRKAEMVQAVEAGLITAEFVMRKHDISPEEWAEWQRKYDRWGESGLKASRDYREPGRRNHRRKQMKDI